MGVSKRMAMLSQERSQNGKPPRDVEFLDRVAPTLLEMMTKIPDEARERKTASVMIFWEDGSFKVLINDRAVDRKLWRSIPALDDTLLELLETAVTEEFADWKFGASWKSER